jgi:hypothetical protein
VPADGTRMPHRLLAATVMRRPTFKFGGGALAMAIGPGVGMGGASTWMVLAHAPIAAAITIGLGTVATAVVAIVKIRSDRSPEQVRAESQAASARKVDDKERAMLLTTLDALATNTKADVAASRDGLIDLLRRPAVSPQGGPAELPPSVTVHDEGPDMPATPNGQISDEQISDEQIQKMILDEQPDSNTEALTLAFV